MLTAAREPQVGVQCVKTMPDASLQQQVSIPASFGGESVPNTNLPPTQGVLNLIMLKYLQTVNPSTEEEFNGFLRYMRDVRQVAVVDTESGSLIITVECSSLEILEGLWEDYRTGHLNDMAQKYLVTEDILKEFGLIEVRLMTTILEDEYRACQEYFLQKPGEDERCNYTFFYLPSLFLLRWFLLSFLFADETRSAVVTASCFSEEENTINSELECIGDVLFITYDRVP